MNITGIDEITSDLSSVACDRWMYRDGSNLKSSYLASSKARERLVRTGQEQLLSITRREIDLYMDVHG